MDPQIPTSFIPKRPIDSGVVNEQHSTRAVGLLSLIAAIVVIATVLSFVFVYLYQRSLNAQAVKLEQSINDARNGVGTDFLADMKRLNARIVGVTALLNKHIVVTPIFQALQATTLRSVQYQSFTYQIVADPVTKAQVVQVELTGITKSYSTIALQSDAFTQNTLIKNPVFSDLTVNDKDSSISFKLSFDVDLTDLSFATFIAGKQLGTKVLPTSGVPATTTSAAPATPPTSAPSTTKTTTTGTAGAATQP